MEPVEDLGSKVNKCSYINEYINFFCYVGQDRPLTLTNNQVYSNDKFYLWPVYSGERLRASEPSCFIIIILFYYILYTL